MHYTITIIYYLRLYYTILILYYTYIIFVLVLMRPLLYSTPLLNRSLVLVRVVWHPLGPALAERSNQSRQMADYMWEALRDSGLAGESCFLGDSWAFVVKLELFLCWAL